MAPLSQDQEPPGNPARFNNRLIVEDLDTVVDHRPTACPDCGLALSAEPAVETVSVHEHIALPEVKPVVDRRSSWWGVSKSHP